jgi:hypothetical protein
MAITEDVRTTMHLVMHIFVVSEASGTWRRLLGEGPPKRVQSMICVIII